MQARSIRGLAVEQPHRKNRSHQRRRAKRLSSAKRRRKRVAADRLFSDWVHGGAHKSAALLGGADSRIALVAVLRSCLSEERLGCCNTCRMAGFIAPTAYH